MAVGFIIISLKLEAEKNEVQTFDVSFIKVDKTSSIKGGSMDPTGTVDITANQKELDMTFNLNAPHDELSYTVIIKNNSTTSAEIVDLMESPDYDETYYKNLITPVTITHTDIVGKVLEPSEELELKITVYYNPTSLTVTKKTINYKLGLITKSK
jgi:hypothetical protein